MSNGSALKTSKRILLESCLLILVMMLFVTLNILYLRMRGIGDIKKISMDTHGNMLIKTDIGNNYEFIKLDMHGNAEFSVKYPKFDTFSGRTYNYPSIIIIDGDVYIHQEVYNDEKRIVSERILKITKFDEEEIYSIVNADKDKNMFLFNNFSSIDGKLYFLQNIAYDITVMCFDGETVSELETFVIDDYIEYAEIFYANGGYIIYSDNNSNIKRQTVDSDMWDEIIINAGATQGMSYNGDSLFAYMDLYKDTLVVSDFMGNIKLDIGIIADLRNEIAFVGNSLALISRDSQGHGNHILHIESFENYVSHASITPRLNISAYVIHIMRYTLAATIGYIILRLYLFLLIERYTGVSLKLVLSSMPFIAAGIAGVYLYFSNNLIQETKEQRGEQLRLLRLLMEERLDLEIIKNIDLENFNPEHFAQVESALGIVYDSFYSKYNSKDIAKREVYAELIIFNDDVFYIYYAKNFKTGSNIKYLFQRADLENYNSLRDLGVGTSAAPNTKNDGKWNYFLSPIIDDEGNLIAVLETGIDVDMAQNHAKSLAMTLSIMIAIFGAFITAAFSIVLYTGLKSLKDLKKGVQQIADGNKNVKIRVRTKDEIGHITEAFNVMSTQIDHQLSELTLLNESYYRFIPDNLLSLLNKKSITEIRLGNRSDVLLTLMRIDMPCFFPLSGNMTNTELLSFLNSYFDKTVKVINKNDGFVQGYDNAAITGIFEEDPENAIITAFQVQDNIRAYNRERIENGETPVCVGIAINRANVIIGVIGEDTSLKVSIISKHARILTPLQTVAVDLGANILVTGWAFDELKNKYSYRYRYLGKIISTEFDVPIEIYDFYDADTNKHLKLSTSQKFEEGVRLFYALDFSSARKNFISVLMEFPEDKAAGIYLSKCDSFINGNAEELGLVVL